MKTITIDLDEDLSEICDRISNIQSKEILLLIPKGALLLKNPIHAQVLFKKSKDEKKDLLVFTHDESGKALLKKTGFRLYQGTVKKRQKVISGKLKSLPESPVRKRDAAPVSLNEMAGSISERTQKNLSRPQKKFQNEQSWELSKLLLLRTLRRKTVLALSLICGLFFLVVLYIAIPSATIYIKASSNVLETTVNVTLADPNIFKTLFKTTERHVIPMTPISATFEESLTYPATGRIFTGNSSTCTLKLQNQRNSPWELVEKTRFLEKSGIVLRSGAPVKVPSARYTVVRDANGIAVQKKIPGEAVVAVKADERDIHGEIIGERGNLQANTILILPALSSFNQTLLTAINEFPCIGGKTSSDSFITDEDLKAGKEKMVNLLEHKGKGYLMDKTSAENITREKSGIARGYLVLLDLPESIRTTLLGVEIPPDLTGKKADNFFIKGKMKVDGVAYEDQAYGERLEENLISKVHPDKILSSIDSEASTKSPVYSDSDFTTLSRVKLSVTVRGIEEYNFDARSEKGQEILQKILDYVPGKSLVEASAFITNLEEIEKAHIAVWPWWKKTLPERRGSIEIKVE